MRLVILSVSLSMWLSGCVSLPLTNDFRDQLASAHYHYRQGDFVAAEGLLRQLTRADSDLSESWCLLGHIGLRSHRYDEAYAHYQTCLKLNPEQPTIWHNLALVRLRQSTEILIQAGQYSDAAEDSQLLAALLRLQRVQQLSTATE